jgi:hypothetical protein
MNSANLQMEGLLLAVAALCRTLQGKGLLAAEEAEAALLLAEKGASARMRDLSAANQEAVQFPIRFLRRALSGDVQTLDYRTIAADIGRARDEPPA